MLWRRLSFLWLLFETLVTIGEGDMVPGAKYWSIVGSLRYFPPPHNFRAWVLASRATTESEIGSSTRYMIILSGNNYKTNQEQQIIGSRKDHQLMQHKC